MVLAADKPVDQAIYVGPDDIIDGNFIKAGNIIDIAGAVNGDVIVAGNSITISGPVAGDVIVAGNSVRITGEVGGSVRAVASSISIDSAISHNAWVFAGTVSFGQDSSVGWDVYTGAGSVEIKGPIGGNVFAGAGSLIIANKIGKDVKASVDREGQVVLYPEAEVAGNLEYQAADENQLVLKEGAIINGETIRKDLGKGAEFGDTAKTFGVAYLLFKIFSFFSLLVIGVLLISLVPKFMIQVNDVMRQKPWPSLGWGVVYFFLTPIAIFVLLITVIGIPLGLILIPVYIISIYLSKLFAGFVVGIWLFNQLTKNKYKGSLIWPLVLGLLLVMIVTSIPLFGWLLALVLVWWSLGGLIQTKKEIIKDFR